MISLEKIVTQVSLKSLKPLICQLDNVWKGKWKLGCLEKEDLRPKTQKGRPLENEDLENEDPLENEDSLENKDLENEDSLENESSL